MHKITTTVEAEAIEKLTKVNGLLMRVHCDTYYYHPDISNKSEELLEQVQELINTLAQVESSRSNS